MKHTMLNTNSVLHSKDFAILATVKEGVLVLSCTQLTELSSSEERALRFDGCN